MSVPAYAAFQLWCTWIKTDSWDEGVVLLDEVLDLDAPVTLYKSNFSANKFTDQANLSLLFFLERFPRPGANLEFLFAYFLSPLQRRLRPVGYYAPLPLCWLCFQFIYCTLPELLKPNPSLKFSQGLPQNDKWTVVSFLLILSLAMLKFQYVRGWYIPTLAKIRAGSSDYRYLWV